MLKLILYSNSFLYVVVFLGFLTSPSSALMINIFYKSVKLLNALELMLIDKPFVNHKFYIISVPIGFTFYLSDTDYISTISPDNCNDIHMVKIVVG